METNGENFPMLEVGTEYQISKEGLQAIRRVREDKTRTIGDVCAIEGLSEGIKLSVLQTPMQASEEEHIPSSSRLGWVCPHDSKMESGGISGYGCQSTILMCGHRRTH